MTFAICDTSEIEAATAAPDALRGKATRSQNNANRRRPRHNTSGYRHNTSGYKGVCLDRRSGRWRAEISKNGKTIHLGSFATPLEAHAAYLKAARKLFGKFARAE